MKISKTVPFGMMAATLVPLLMEKSKLAQKWHVPDKAKLIARKRLMKHQKSTITPTVKSGSTDVTLAKS